MRREEDFVVYPKGDDANLVKIQSDHRIAMIDMTDGTGVLSEYVAGGAVFIHLSMPGAMTIKVPQSVLDDLKRVGFSSNVLSPGAPVTDIR